MRLKTALHDSPLTSRNPIPEAANAIPSSIEKHVGAETNDENNSVVSPPLNETLRKRT
ncbi:hypothetical protein [Alkalihalophilus pseudofirmus]|uniref:hypothetical protein n=1 Tax=Alkalihalophilus pseudofirmus TaxID=79885 RepID=UPI0013053A50|nr:hypothetical protein [Alkalihalophilus pseudofirmus]